MPEQQVLKTWTSHGYVQICILGDTSNLSSLDPHVMIRSEHPECRLKILENFVDYPEQHFYDQIKLTASPKGYERRQCETTSVVRCDKDS